MTSELYRHFRIDATKVGKKVHDLTVKGALFRVRHRKWSSYLHVVVECDCGKRTVVMWDNFKKGGVKSCGCHRSTQDGLRTKYPSEYNAWKHMLERCEDPDCNVYEYYGARGISVCERWHDFKLFIKDVGPKSSPELTLDRIDNDGNYEPGNVRWATRIQQRNNRRDTKVKIL